MIKKRIDIESPAYLIAANKAAVICHTYYRECRPEQQKSLKCVSEEYSLSEDPVLAVWIENEIKKSEPRYNSRCKVHGFDHAYRVFLYTFVLSKMLALIERDTRVLLFLALNHDIGREDDSNDTFHGFRGAAKAEQICEQFTEEETFLIRAALAAHPFRDKDAISILELFGTANDRQKEKYLLYLSVLKDADALDRFRLSDRSLDLRYLRFAESATLVRAACELVQLYNAADDTPPDSNTIDWDEAADYYGLVSRLAYSYAKEQLETIGIEPGSTLLDVGAGCGRYSIAAAALCRHVTAMDLSEKMLAICRKWCAQWNISNVDTVNCDWNDLSSVSDLGKFDYVLASRTGAMQDILRLSSIAKKGVILINWANAPSFPDLTVKLCGEENLIRYPLGSPARIPRQFGYNCYFRDAYRAGYEPNVRILPDGFRYKFSSREEADRILAGLAAGNIKKNCEERIIKNFKQFYEPLPDGRIMFSIESLAAVIWWNIAK